MAPAGRAGGGPAGAPSRPRLGRRAGRGRGAHAPAIPQAGARDARRVRLPTATRHRAQAPGRPSRPGGVGCHGDGWEGGSPRPRRRGTARRPAGAHLPSRAGSAHGPGTCRASGTAAARHTGEQRRRPPWRYPPAFHRAVSRLCAHSPSPPADELADDLDGRSCLYLDGRASSPALPLPPCPRFPAAPRLRIWRLVWSGVLAADVVRNWADSVGRLQSSTSGMTAIASGRPLASSWTL